MNVNQMETSINEISNHMAAASTLLEDIKEWIADGKKFFAPAPVATAQSMAATPEVISVPLRTAIKRPRKCFGVSKYVRPYLVKLVNVGDIISIPVAGGFPSKNIQSSASSVAGRMWGKGVVQTSADEKEVIVQLVNPKGASK